MPARRRELKPDSKGRYRPYLGFRVDDKGNRKEHRFNLGTDKREAERRIERLYDLHDESEAVVGETIWTPFAFYGYGPELLPDLLGFGKGAIVPFGQMCHWAR